MAILDIVGSCKPTFSVLSSFLSRRLAAVHFVAALASLFLACSAMAVTPNFVQGNSAVPQTPQAKVTVAFSAAQKLGDLNVVVVGWGNATSQISSVTDSKGNLYHLAVGPTALTDSATLTQSIYYAKNIVAALAGANVVTLSFNAAVASPDIRILEYSGVDPVNALDVSAAATGDSAISTSGAILTTNAMDDAYSPMREEVALGEGSNQGFESPYLHFLDCQGLTEESSK